MIQANELRLGNLVQDDNGFIFKIKNISENSVVAYPVSADYNIVLAKGGGVRMLSPNPILITGELLINFGFGRTPNNIFYLKWFVGADKTKTIEIEIVDDEVFASFYIGKGEDRMLIEIKYVHQLQNLYYALTGKELEIKL